jgi:hypothetical protein
MAGRRPSRRSRWQHWQTSVVSTRYLSPEAAQAGYTLLYVPPASREAFFTCVGLLQAVGHAGSAETDHAEALEAWHLWTKRLTAYLERRAAGKPGTLPALPPALAALGAEENRYAVSTS